jgi:hypothetical protein
MILRKPQKDEVGSSEEFYSEESKEDIDQKKHKVPETQVSTNPNKNWQSNKPKRMCQSNLCSSI